jgi:hypothetical protein
MRLSDVTRAVAGRSRCGYEGPMFDGAPFANLPDDALAFDPLRDVRSRGVSRSDTNFARLLLLLRLSRP